MCTLYRRTFTVQWTSYILIYLFFFFFAWTKPKPFPVILARIRISSHQISIRYLLFKIYFCFSLLLFSYVKCCRRGRNLHRDMPAKTCKITKISQKLRCTYANWQFRKLVLRREKYIGKNCSFWFDGFSSFCMAYS